MCSLSTNFVSCTYRPQVDRPRAGRGQSLRQVLVGLALREHVVLGVARLEHGDDAITGGEAVDRVDLREALSRLACGCVLAAGREAANLLFEIRQVEVLDSSCSTPLEDLPACMLHFGSPARAAAD
jgi:hypothetical protein